jgi:hypothetical protein
MQDFGTWLASSWGTFVAGSLLILGLVAAFSRSLRLYFKIQNTVFSSRSFPSR